MTTRHVPLTDEQIGRLLDALPVREFADVLLVLAHTQDPTLKLLSGTGLPDGGVSLLRRQAG